MTNQIRVVVQNPHALERAGMAALLRSADSLSVVGASPDCETTAALVGKAEQVVVLVDLPSGPHGGGLEDVRRLHTLATNPRVVVLRREYAREQVLAAFEAGASACVSTSADLEDLLNAVRAAQAGQTFCCPIVARVLVESPANPSAEVPTLGLRPLTPRELEVLERIARGQTDRQIAGTLGLAVGTVHTHRKHIMAKLGVRNVAGLLRRARSLGLLQA
jgi:DNA-binding NarL/FixJ family response regulator